ncbi:MAG: efflux RND transporter permease subunit, partial [Chitinophagaceae bacterium]|nr:efflux RND transporter permease subunit [Chitinophagaceae bacterium]
LAMVFGMLPIALAKGTASEWKNGLAWVIIGGLLSSLILTVYLVPVVYYVVDTLKEKFGRKPVQSKMPQIITNETAS